MSELEETFTAVHALPLFEQMRLAADILETASMRYANDKEHLRGLKYELFDWRPVNLRSVARDFETEDQLEATRSAQIEELAQVIYQHWPLIDSLGNPANRLDSKKIIDAAHVRCRAIATKLLDEGWSKPPTAEQEPS